MPSWVEPVWRYILTEGLPATLLISAIAVVGSALIGIVLGTLLTIEWRPSRLLIRFYIEVFRGLPLLVTVPDTPLVNVRASMELPPAARAPGAN